MKPYEPNVKLPLANSYNTRGINGYADIVTNGLDQQKVNLVYRPVTNAMTGKTTLYLCKRPGIALDSDNASFGTSGQVAYLSAFGAALAGTASSAQWVFSTNNNDIRASSSTTTTVIETAANNFPLYVDHTSIGGNDTVVVQIGSDFATQTAWYSTAIATFTQITDGDYPDTTGKMEYLDGYAFAALDSANVQRIYNSDVNSLSSWTSTSFITKQIQQDKLQGLMRLGNLIIGAGQETLEIFRNVGNTVGSPLESIQQLATDGGIQMTVSGHYYCVIQGKLYFRGRRGGATSTSLNVFDGSSVQTVSTPAIEAILSSQPSYSVNAINFQGRSAVSVSLAATSAATQIFLLYFPDYKEWFTWQSTVFCPINGGGRWFLGTGSNQNKLYNFVSATNNWQDASTDFDAYTQFILPADGNERKVMRSLGLLGDTPSSAFSFTVQKKDNDESSWVTIGSLDMTSPNKTLTSCGSWIGQRQIKILNQSNNEGRITMFLARVE